MYPVEQTGGTGCGVDEIVKTIESDQSLAAKILQVANSSGGNKNRICQEGHRLSGADNVMNILLSAAAFNNDKAISNFSET